MRVPGHAGCGYPYSLHQITETGAEPETDRPRDDFSPRRGSRFEKGRMPRGGGTEMDMPPVVSPQEWEAARQELLVKEKEHTRARDALAAERRRMPRMAVEKDYRFEGPNGPASLLDLFEGRRQLIVSRAFYEPGITTTAEGTSCPERACVGCSFVADQVAHPAHLTGRDTSLAFASRAPQEEIQGLKKRHGWG